MTKPKQKAILREAETKDMKSIIYLMEKLIEYELEIADTKVIEDLQERKRIIMETVAKALVNPDQKVWVVDKSGRILGAFIAEKRFFPLTIESNNPVCQFTHAYSQKTVISFHKIHNEIMKWAKEKGCKSIVTVCIAGNESANLLAQKFGYKQKSITHEKEIL